MLLASFIRQSAPILGLVFTVIGLGQAATTPIVNLSPARPAEVSVTPTAAMLVSADADRPATRLASTEKPPTTLADLPAQAQASVHAAHGRDRAIYHAEALDEGFRLANPAHRIEARFNKDGAALQAGNLRWNLRLIALGYGETLTELPFRAPRAELNRIEYVHDVLTEWYLNGPLGIEQGFTLATPPTGEKAGALTLALELPHDLTFTLDEKGRGLRLTGAEGTALAYRGLTAFDARGRELPAWMEIADTRLHLRVDDTAAVYPITVDPFVQQAYVKASNTGVDDQFGTAVALSGDGNTLAVGAINEESNATGVDGNQADNSAADSGAVYVFTRSGSTWTQQAYVKASNTGAGDQFGTAVTLSGDGNTLAVGATGEDSNATGIGGADNNSAADSGAVYVFTRSGSTWTQQAYVKASNTGSFDNFGTAVALSGDGNTLAVGAINEDSNATGIGGADNNSTAASGAVYVFTRASATWTQQAYVKASNTGDSDQFGNAVALSSDGNTLAVGAHQEKSNATGIGGDQTNNSASIAGAVYVFTRSGATWTQQAYVKASNTGADDRFGTAVALSSDGNTLAVGAIFEDSAATGIGGAQSDNSADESGAVYVFTRSGSTWTQQAYVKASNTGAGDRFGTAVTLSGDGNTLAVGATGEDSNGIGNDQADNSAINSGAVYVSLANPDLTATKANNVGGSLVLGGSFIWTVSVQNNEVGSAAFTSGQMFLRDSLPAGPTYGAPAVQSVVNVTNSASISCAVAANVLACTASGATVTLGALTGRFDVAFTVTPTAAGTLANPSAGVCQVDPDFLITEAFEVNNFCADTVVVIDSGGGGGGGGGGVPPSPTPLVNVAVNGNPAAEVTLGNPVALTYQVVGCQNQEMFLVVNAPAVGVPWSYLNVAGQWIPLPANLADITPFTTSGPADGGYFLYVGNVPIGDYELVLACDFVVNGHLDYTGGTSINGVYDYILLHVN